MDNTLTIDASFFNQWGFPSLIKTLEYPDRIELVYKQISNVSYTVHPSSPPEERVYKIVFSCVDGKWNKSDPIFGKIIQPTGESYEFPEKK